MSTLGFGHEAGIPAGGQEFTGGPGVEQDFAAGGGEADLASQPEAADPRRLSQIAHGVGFIARGAGRILAEAPGWILPVGVPGGSAETSEWFNHTRTNDLESHWDDSEHGHLG